MPFRILIIDDDASVIGALSMVLAGQGWKNVSTAETVDEAKVMIESECFSLIISDNTTPGRMRGTDLRDWLRKTNRRIPFILLTGDDAVLDATILKPASMELIIALARTASKSYE
jgi:DNA-binding NtrC family response regulator